MINRQKAISILQSLDSESLVRALAANGIKVDQKDGDGEVLGALAPDQDNNKITGWNERKIQVKGTDDRPSLVDKEYLQPQERADETVKSAVDTPYMEEDFDASLDPYMHPAG